MRRVAAAAIVAAGFASVAVWRLNEIADANSAAGVGKRLDHHEECARLLQILLGAKYFSQP